jgi:hypothetical protein
MNGPLKTQRPAGGGSKAERNDSTDHANPNPLGLVAQAAAAGKALAVWLYCADLRSLQATQGAFARNPAWRSI